MFVNYSESENDLTYSQQTELLELYNTLCSPQRTVYRYDLRDTATFTEVFNEVGNLNGDLLPEWYNQKFKEKQPKKEEKMNEQNETPKNESSEVKNVLFVQRTVMEDGEYVACLTNAETAGFHKTDWLFGKDFNEAEKMCEEKNEKSGISKIDALVIVATSMGNANKKKEESKKKKSKRMKM